MDNLVLSTTYYIDNKTKSIEVGLNQLSNYSAVVRLSNNISQQYKEDDIPDALVLNEMEWSKLFSCIETFNLFFTNCSTAATINATTTVTQDMELNIGNYVIEYNYELHVISFKFKVIEDISIICIDINVSFWKELLRLHTCVMYRLKMINNYKFYAKIVHSRIVNYYLCQIRKGEIDCTTLFPVKFRSMLISLTSDVLPKSSFNINYNHFNPEICLILNAEIRAYSADIIFRHISNALVNNCNNEWWWN